MTDIRKVWALIAVREACDSPGDWWHEGWVTSAAFVDAAVLSELIDAVRQESHRHSFAAIAGLADMSTAPPLGRACACRLCAAFAAFDAVMLPDKTALLVYGDTVREVPAGSLSITLNGPLPDTETPA